MTAATGDHDVTDFVHRTRHHSAHPPKSLSYRPRDLGDRGMDVGGTDDAQAVATIKSATERGITLIDTAPAYGFGHAEELVGQALAESGARDNVHIATKVGLNWQDGNVFRDASRARIRKEVEDFAPASTDQGDRPLPGALARSENTDRGDGGSDAGTLP